MKILWICGLPRQVQREMLHDQDYGAYADWSWILGHLPPPDDVELHIACRTARHTAYQEFSYQGARFHLVPVKSRARVLCLFHFDWIYFRDLASRLSPDVVHGWGTEDAYALAAMKLSPERHLVQVQGNLNTYLRRVPMPWATRLGALSERRVLARARHVVAENEYSLGSARPMIRTRSIHVIEHPLRAGFLEAMPGTGEARQILFVGAIEERKGIWDAIEAFREGAPENWRLVIVGSGQEKPVATLQRYLSDNRLQGRVAHHPQLTTAEIISLMQQCSVFLLPTRIDTGPTALKEALAMGLWPVCYDNSGPAYYIRRFGYGHLVEDLNRAALAECLKETLVAQEWKRAENRARIESVIRPRFQRINIWRELTKLYAEIASRKGS